MQESRPTVYLFTETYPFPGPDDPFLPAEIRVLARTFDVRLIPVLRTDRPVPDLPSGVSFDDGLAAYSASARVRLVSTLLALLSPRLYAELWNQRPQSLSPRAAGTVVVRLARALAVRRWVRREFVSLASDQAVIVYCWWSAAYAVGVALALTSPRPLLVTRAHGYDLYAEQEAIGFVPFQEVLLGRADAILSASRAGANYLKARYPDMSPKIDTAYLGIEGQDRESPASEDGVLRIVTCSAVIPVKRITLLADALVRLTSLAPELSFHWTHIGGGPQWEALRHQVAAATALADRTTLTGWMEPEEVKVWLVSNPVDVFVNVSSSEGLPVTLMEAASCGVPMLATAVGGNPEIVDDSCGALLPANPTVEQVAGALLTFSRLSPVERQVLREGARGRWASRFSAERNYRVFARHLAYLSHVTR